MKNNRLKFMLSVLVASISMVIICAFIIVPTISFSDKTRENGNTFVNKNYETNLGGGNVSSSTTENNASDVKDNGKVEFFINEQSVSKTKTIVGETTMFEISFKVFAVNESNSAKTIKSSAFSGDYDISKFATFYKFECKQAGLSKIIEPNESEDFDISIVYVVTDVENFKANQKFDLTISYMSDEIISALVWQFEAFKLQMVRFFNVKIISIYCNLLTFVLYYNYEG